MFPAQNENNGSIPGSTAQQAVVSTSVVAAHDLKSSRDLPPVVGNNGMHLHILRLLIPIGFIVGTMALFAFILPRIRQQALPVATSTPEPTLSPATPVPTVRPDPYKDWKAYVNRSAELSFKYPPNMSLKEEKAAGDTYVITIGEDASSSATFAKIVSSRKLTAEAFLSAYLGTLANEKTEEVQISGIIGKQGDHVMAGGGEGIPVHFANITRDNSQFLFINFMPEQGVLFTNLVSSVRLVTQGITSDWQTYTNSFGNYTLRFPPGWTAVAGSATASAQTVSIRKKADEPQFQTVVIDAQVAGGKQKIELTASEIISSLQNLSGWKETPTLDFRSLGGGQAQLISGEKDGAWTQYAVVWYRNMLLQLTWKDTLLRPEQNTFDDIFGSLQFR